MSNEDVETVEIDQRVASIFQAKVKVIGSHMPVGSWLCPRCQKSCYASDIFDNYMYKWLISCSHCKYSFRKIEEYSTMSSFVRFKLYGRIPKDMDFRIDGQNAEILYGIKAGEYAASYEMYKSFVDAAVAHAFDHTWHVKLDRNSKEVVTIWRD